MKIIVQTAADLDALLQTDPQGYRDQLTAILGSSRIRTNQAEYPEDYDGALSEGDDGYVAPQWVEIDDVATLGRARTAVARSLQMSLSNLKRHYRAQGLSESDIHAIIPDRGRPRNRVTPPAPQPPAP